MQVGDHVTVYRHTKSGTEIEGRAVLVYNQGYGERRNHTVEWWLLQFEGDVRQYARPFAVEPDPQEGYSAVIQKSQKE